MASRRSSAARYARALLAVSLKEEDPKRVGDQLAEFAALFGAEPRLRAVLENPAVPVPRKRGLVQTLVKRMTVAPVVEKLLLLLAERDRLVLLDDLTTAYQTALMDHLGIVRATVTSAIPLPSDRLEALQRKLAEVTGRQVQLDAHVDPSIVGGLVTRLGSVVYDGSVTRHLARIKEKLVETG
jgi:F-type H+-transporting ATPase subunit delta